MTDIFISYDSEDKERAQTIADALIKKGWSVWWDRNLIAGENYQKEIDRALKEAKCVLVLWSQHSVESTWVKAEATQGSEKLIPVSIEPEVTIPVPFNVMHYEDLSEWDGSAEFGAFTKLLAAIEGKAGLASTSDLSDEDVILIHRLESLKHDLERVEKVRDYMQDIQDLLTDESSSKLWNEILSTANSHIRKFNTYVEDVRSNVLRSDAQTEHRGQDTWRQYNKILSACGDLFYETTEFLTGLVLRNALFQHAKEEGSRTSHVYRIADEMVKRAAGITNKSFSTTVPSHTDSVTRTLLCLVRLRFPGWSIWHLPLLAYEYGRLLIEQDPQLIKFLKTYPVDVSLSKGLDELFPDAFATYYVGPAYAYVVTYLQLNPSSKSGVDAERAEVVFNTLDHMGQREKGEHPYQDVIASLRRDWRTAIHCAHEEADELPEEKGEFLSEFSRLSLIELRGHYNPELGFPAKDPYQGWRESENWADQWQAQLRDDQQLEVPNGLGRGNSLRDVLNAGWICRLKFKEDIDRIAAVMEDSCREIMGISPMGEETEPETASGLALM